jgi:RsiW-degrading membrane proteinase PrsW (M82 family)
MVLSITIILAVPFIIMEFVPLSLEHGVAEWPKVLGFLFSGAISFLWIVYLRKLDIYEPEKWRYIIIIFVVSCLTIWAVFPISSFINNLGFVLNGNPINDFLYCVFSIGMVEELVKLVPVIIFINNKKMFNESYDYLFYASV